MIPYGRQKISSEDIEAVSQALRSDFITQGPRVQEFETQISKYCGSHHAVAVSSATAGLHLAMVALGVGPRDAVIVPSLTFLASVNCIEYVGARPIFVDIDPQTYTLDLNEVESILKKEKAVKAIIAVDFAGLPVPLQRLKELGQRYGIKIVEDASHAIGADYREKEGWKKVGASSCADVTIFSFHPVKHMTTGEGGMFLTNDPDLAEKGRLLRTHCMHREISKDRPWYYEMNDLGFNYRLTDFQSALGISQLKKIDSWVDKRRYIAKIYDEIFRESPIRTPVHETKDARSSFHLYVIQTEKRDALYHELRKNEILTQVHYIPVHWQPYYQKKYGTRKGQLPVTEAYFEKCLSLPCFVDLSSDQCHKVGELILGFL